MKRAISILLCGVFFIIALCSCADKTSVVGRWIDDRTEAVCEYTADGYYYEYINEGFTTDKTRYIAKDGKITYYVDGLAPKDGFSVDYIVTEDGELLINGEILYRPLNNPEKDD